MHPGARVTRLDGPAARRSLTHAAMGTVIAHVAYGPAADASLVAVRREIERIEVLLSRFRPDSEISRVNRSAGGPPVPVSLDTCEVLAQAAAFSGRLPGCFDVTVGPLVRVWQAARETRVAPDPARIGEALTLVDHRDVVLEPAEVAAGLRRPGQSIDLGGIGKGFAADCAVDVFRRFGVTSAFSNLGGNVVARGSRPDGSAWQIGIQHPRKEGLIGAVAVMDKAVVTSGDYQRYYTDPTGARRHHILDPSTGYPARSGLISVSIVAERATAADALSTMVFVAGLERGLGLLDGCCAEAVLVNEDLRIYITPGLRECFRAEDGVAVMVLA